jgi:hypothetical protein
MEALLDVQKAATEREEEAKAKLQEVERREADVVGI